MFLAAMDVNVEVFGRMELLSQPGLLFGRLGDVHFPAVGLQELAEAFACMVVVGGVIVNRGGSCCSSFFIDSIRCRHGDGRNAAQSGYLSTLLLYWEMEDGRKVFKERKASSPARPVGQQPISCSSLSSQAGAAY